MKYIQFEKVGRTILVTLTRPEKLNSIDRSGFQEFKSFLDDCHRKIKDFDCMIITGEGEKAFCAGGDIKELSMMDSVQVGDLSFLAQSLMSTLKQLPIPVIAAVNGIAFGGGFELALSCDLIYSSENALFGLPEVDLGIIPGFGGCVRLPRYIGIAKTKEMIYTSKKITATEASKLGICLKVFGNKKELLNGAFDTANLISLKSHNAISVVKKVLNHVDKEYELLEVEREGYREVFRHPDSKKGISDFLNRKRNA